MTPAMSRLRPLPTARVQRGAVLLFTLVALVIMLIAAVALIRSFNTSLSTAGNLAFKRDVQNQAERVMPGVLALMSGTGALATTAQRAADRVALNYSATLLPTNEQGIPTVLLDDAAFAAKWTRADEQVLVNGVSTGVSIRYVIDRQCRNDGDEVLLGKDDCVQWLDTALGNSGSNWQKPAELSIGGAAAAASAVGATGPSTAQGSAGVGAVPPQVVYRVSIRISGPRFTQAFFQTTFTL